MNTNNKRPVEFAINAAIGKLATLMVNRDAGIADTTWLIKAKNLPEFINEVESVLNELKKAKGAK